MDPSVEATARNERQPRGPKGWRLYDAGPQDAPTAIGRMPALAQSVSSGDWDGILLTGVWGRAHFNVGWFEDVDAVLDMEAARREGVDVVRRPVLGGGTAFYDAGCAAMAAFFVPHDTRETLDDVFDRFLPVLRAVLDRLSLREAVLEEGDIRWRGRKLGALVSQNVMTSRVAGCFLNLRRPDMDLYVKVAHVPDEKLADKAVKDMREYVATPADVRGTDVSYDEFRDAVVEAFRAQTGLDLKAEGPTSDEDANVESFASLVSSEGWVRRVSTSRFTADVPAGCRVGFANHKGRKLVRAGVAVDADDVLRSVLLAGDMHLAPPETLDDLARSLAGTPARDAGRIRAAVEAAVAGAEQADAHLGVTAEDFITAIERAIEEASHGPA